MNELALFAGAGGGLLATRWLLGWRTVCYVENAEYPVEVLKARIKDGLLDDAPIWSDARTFDGQPWRGCVDIVSAGFPCQPFSSAGKRLADRDDRNLWPDTIRIIREVRPQFVLLENVPNLRTPIRRRKRKRPSYFGTVLGNLASGGYDVRWDCIPASAIGANHQRDRLWIVAHANGGRFEEHAEFHSEAQANATNGHPCRRYAGGCGDKMADSDRDECSLHQSGEQAQIQVGSDIAGSGKYLANAYGSPERYGHHGTGEIQPDEAQTEWWNVEPSVGRVADELAHWLDFS